MFIYKCLSTSYTCNCRITKMGKLNSHHIISILSAHAVTYMKQPILPVATLTRQPWAFKQSDHTEQFLDNSM